MSSSSERPPLPDALARETERRRAELLRPTLNRAERRGHLTVNVMSKRRPFGWEKR